MLFGSIIATYSNKIVVESCNEYTLPEERKMQRSTLTTVLALSNNSDAIALLIDATSMV
jgi:hypothetical protein